MVRCQLTWTIERLKQEITSTVGTPVEDQRLSFGGKKLLDEETLSQCGIRRVDILHLE
jgi:hypothetical protein